MAFPAHADLGFMSVLELYEDLVAAKKLERDRAQEQLLARFDALERRVTAHRSARRTRPVGWLFGSRNHDEPVKGIYVFGDVGRGKTMLMDLFFEESPVVRKRRSHFHEFMADVHERVRVFRQKLKDGEIERRGYLPQADRDRHGEKRGAQQGQPGRTEAVGARRDGLGEPVDGRIEDRQPERDVAAEIRHHPEGRAPLGRRGDRDVADEFEREGREEQAERGVARVVGDQLEQGASVPARTMRMIASMTWAPVVMVAAEVPGSTTRFHSRPPKATATSAASIRLPRLLRRGGTRRRWRRRAG